MKNFPVEMSQVRACMKLFDFLQERHNDRYTKFEAYCYLLNKACEHYIPENLLKDDLPALADCQFITTKTELSEIWHWHRATVRTFLDKLSEYGQLEKYDMTKGTVYTMTCLKTAVVQNQSPVQMFDAMAKYTLFSWASGQSSHKEAAIVCEQIIKNAVTLCDDNLPSESQTEKANGDYTMFASIIRYAIVSFLHKVDVKSVPDSLVHNLLILFDELLDNDWSQLLLFIEALPDISKDYSVEKFPLKTKEDKQLFELIKADYRLLLSQTMVEPSAQSSSNEITTI